jgi:two-component sensor histidine kinase
MVFDDEVRPGFLRAVLARRRVLGVALLFWSLPALLVTVGMLAQGEVASVPQAFFAEGLGWYNWALLTPFIFELVRRVPFDGPAKRRVVLVHAGAGLLAGLIQCGVSIVLAMSFGPPRTEPTSWLAAVVWIPFGIVFYAAIAGVGAALDYLRRLREREVQAARLKTLLVESRLGALRMQLQPHFLFNTLNTVAMLVRQGDQQTSVRVLARLSELLRQVLNEERNGEITLREELETTARYLEIEEIRFGDRLRVELAVDERVQDVLVPSMLLQPLVENAIRHGIARRAAATCVRIEADMEDGAVLLQVSDDGPGFPAGFDVERQSGIGLRNTAERLRYHYMGKASLTTDAAPGGGAAVRLRLPFRAKATANGG